MGDLIRLARGCWLAAEAIDDLLARCAAATSVCGDDAFVSSTTAGRLHELWLPQLPDEIHLATVTPGLAGRNMSRTHRPEFVAHRRQIEACDRAWIGGVPVLGLERTWFDLASVLSLPALVAAGDSALRRGASRARMQEILRDSARRRGMATARAALPLLDERSRSRPESLLRVAATAPDLPCLQVNEAVYRDGGRGWLAEPDLSLPEAKIALEYIGEDHGKIGRRRKDISRTVDMRQEDWVVLEYGPAEVFGRPWEIAPDLRRLITERAPALLGVRVRTYPPCPRPRRVAT